MHSVAALLSCLLLTIHGYRNQSLTTSGSIAAFFVGLIIFANKNNAFAGSLLAFYLSSSKLTKYKAKVKKEREYGHKVGGQRTATQVFSNGC